VQQAPYIPVPNGFCYPNTQSMKALNTWLKLDYDITDKIHAKGIFAYSDYSDTVMQSGDESPLGYVGDLRPVRAQDAAGASGSRGAAPDGGRGSQVAGAA
jgi:hypothetical protein